MALRVLHLVGSAVDDFYCELSRLYAADCLAATTDPSRYEFHVAYVTPDRRWRFPADLSADGIAAAPPLSAGEALAHIETLRPGVMVPQMFCRPGMTVYRALFDVLGVPYLGNTPDVMALTADKARARAVVAAAGVDVPDGEVLERGEHPTIAPPAVVKPVDADNSLGVTLVHEQAGYDAALDSAFEHSERALVETFVPLGREVRCGILVEGGQLVCLPLEEYAVDARDTPIRLAEDKLRRDDAGRLGLVAKSTDRAWLVSRDDPLTDRVWDVARRCHVALGARHYSLFDFRVDPSGRPWFLEAGLYNSFATTSVIAMMSAATGRALPELFGSMVETAMGGVR
ncbi:MAG: D-alanine--D-alanine ligase [Jatrophihabitans sp.]